MFSLDDRRQISYRYYRSECAKLRSSPGFAWFSVTVMYMLADASLMPVHSPSLQLAASKDAVQIGALGPWLFECSAFSVH
ncbi:hypothetical protein BOTBODRAFT_257840 [Botryobasidium botryosum FD-172 SS1]|uniref:Uncharacterized protein n=1 Tax=Botryobasidium botryosum (strain FD-172 SS1) TaxID=930990 RepID=A0A067MXF4_BOTB1|nr:hypothetical protein BOTBODRAFT_257840 [Botryobasidium botryosum FD-172 SS1]